MSGRLRVTVKDSLGAAVRDMLVAVRLISTGALNIYPSSLVRQKILGVPSVTVGGARDPWLQPYSHIDPWNYPMGSGAAYATISEPRWQPLGWNVWGGYLSGIFIAQVTDPIRKVWTSTGIEKKTIQTPDNAYVSGAWGQNQDNVLLLFKYDKTAYEESQTLHRYQNTPLSIPGAAALDWVIENIGFGFKIPQTRDPRGYGWYPLDTTWDWFRAIRGGALGGTLRIGELTTSYGIQHAVALNLTGSVLNPVSPAGVAWVWPAASADSGASTWYSGTGNVWMGSRLALFPELDLTGALPTALGLETTQGRELARAVQDWGFYVIDTTAPAGSMTLPGQSGLASADLGGWDSPTMTKFHNDIRRIVAACKIISNNHSSGGAPPGNIPGGSTGVLRKPLLPAF